MFSAVHAQLEELVPRGMSRPELEAGVAAVARLEAHAVERRLAFLAEIDDLDDGGVTGADVNRSRARRSKRSSTKAASTAKSLAKMPETRKALAKGEINEEHANAAADAAERTSPAEADRALVKKAKAQPADMFAKKARDWAGSKERESAKAKRTERQRSAREARVWTDADGMICLLAKFDPLTGRQITGRLAEAYDRLWRADGGRDGRPDDARSPEQRRADALSEMLLGAVQAAGKRPHPKHSVIVALDYNRLARRDPDAAACISDGEPLPQSMVDMIACDSAIAGAIYGADGAVMWQGRSIRLATDDQWTQLVARDGGCIGCGASPAHCEVHHVDYWEDLGNTDIDRLVLLCSHDHHLTHSGSHVLIETDTGWQLIRAQAQRRPESWAA